MKKQDVKNIAMQFMEMAKLNLARDKHLVPVGMLFKGEEQAVTMLRFKDEYEKAKVAQEFVKTANAMKPDFVIVIQDAYCVKAKIGDDITTRPSQHPERVDIIILAIKTPNYHYVVRQEYYPCDDRHITFGEIEGMYINEGEGHFLFIDGIYDSPKEGRC